MRNPIAPNARKETKDKPDKAWGSITFDDLDGSGFSPTVDWAAKKKLERKWKEKQNRFITGSSPHISFEIDTRVRKKEAPKKQSLLNEKSRVTKSQRRSLTRALEAQITDLSAFLWKEILPFALAWGTAIHDTEDRLSQVIGVETFPIRGYVTSRVNEAIQLRINRCISGQFKLTPSEQEILRLNLIRKFDTVIKQKPVKQVEPPSDRVPA